MKTFLSTFGIFLLVILLGTILGLCCFLLQVYSSMLIVGQSVNFIPEKLPMICLFYSIIVSCVCSCVLFVLYTIRHPEKTIPRTFAYVTVLLLSWLIIMPSCLHGFKSVSENFVFEKSSMPSSKYFRPDGEGIFFYSSVNDDKATANGIYIDIAGFAKSKTGVVKLDNISVDKSSSFPYSDLLIKNSLKIPEFIIPAANAGEILFKKAMSYFNDGIFSWLEFATMGLAFLSLIGLKKTFHWRLMNCIFVFLGFVGILAINTFYFTGWTGSFWGFEIPFWVMNCIISVIFGCIGIVFSVIRKDPNMEQS